VERGDCLFLNKTLNAQAVGARAIVFYNNILRAGYFIPAIPENQPNPSIPSFMISREDGLRWRTAIQTAVAPGEVAQPPRINITSSRCSILTDEPQFPQPSGDTTLDNDVEALAAENWDSIDGRRSCNPWQADPSGMYFYSGNNKHFHWIYSVLTLNLRFVRDGRLTFRYAVESENEYDGLDFEVDEEQRFLRISQQQPYGTFSVAVERGTHTFRWVYAKDYSSTVGADQAKLQFLEVEGTDYADLECQPCRGSGSRYRCATCAANQYLQMDPNSQTHCQSCPQDFFSPHGSIGSNSCARRRPCVVWDMEMTQSPGQPMPGHDCEGAWMTFDYAWRQPQTCDSAHIDSFHLPVPSQNVSCSDCQPHETRSPIGSCVPAVINCPTGSRPVRERVVVRWFGWPQNFSQEMQRPVAGGVHSPGEGWRLAPDGWSAIVGSAFGDDAHADTTTTNGPAFAAGPGMEVEAALLHYDVQLESAGLLSFAFEVVPADAWGRSAVLLVNGSTFDRLVLLHEGDLSSQAQSNGPSFGYQSNSAASRTPGLSARLRASASLPQGTHRISWSWRYDANAAVDQGDGIDIKSGVRLLRVSVSHAVGAGASVCEPCPAGSEVVGSHCQPCSPGLSTTLYPANFTTLNCHPCAVGRASPVAGSASCHECSDGLISQSGAAHCQLSTELKAPGRFGQGFPQATHFWNLTGLAEAWRTTIGRNASSWGTHKLQKVEDYYFSLSFFTPVASPTFFSLAEKLDTETAFWWQRLPDRDASQGGAFALGVNEGGGRCTSGAQTKRVGAALHKLEVALHPAPGIWATFHGACTGLGGRTTYRTARVFFRCDPSAPIPEEAPLDLSGYQHVQDLEFLQRPTSPWSCDDVDLQWRTAAACPLCTPDDFVPIRAETCYNGMRTVDHIPRKWSGFTCIGGAPAPASYQEESCTPAWQLVAVVVGAILTCWIVGSILAYVLVLRMRYAKYMTLDEALELEKDSVPGETVGNRS